MNKLVISVNIGNCILLYSSVPDSRHIRVQMRLRGGLGSVQECEIDTS